MFFIPLRNLGPKVQAQDILKLGELKNYLFALSLSSSSTRPSKMLPSFLKEPKIMRKRKNHTKERAHYTSFPLNQETEALFYYCNISQGPPSKTQRQTALTFCRLFTKQRA